MLSAPARPRHLRAALLALLALPFAAHPTPAAPLSVRVYPLAEVKPGLAADARTVFQGTQVESFHLEVLGVVRRGAASGSLILARATEPRIEHTGIVAGMSGSPVYAADGRLLGALAYAWGFAKDPICGITPIEEMLGVWNLQDLPSPDDFRGGGLPAPPGDGDGEPGGGAPRDAGASRGGGEPRDRASTALPELRTPLAAAGFAPEVLRLLEPWAEEHGFLLTPGGTTGGAGADEGAGGSASAATETSAAPGTSTLSGTSAAPAALAPGDAVAVDLLRGDAGLAAIGTVTAVEGDRVLAFGHPFFLSGPTRLPMSRAEITAVIPSLDNSFKVGTSGVIVGTLTEDRRTAVSGRLGPPPEMLPVAVHVRVPGAPEETFHFQAAKQRQLAPLAVGAAVINSALARGAIPSESTWRWKLAATLRPRSGGPARRLELSDVLPGEGLPVFALVQTVVSGLLDNAWEPVDLDQIEVGLDVAPRLEAARVVAVRLERPRVRPGETVRVEVDLQSHRGPVQTTALEYPVPEKPAPSTLTLFVGGGAELARYDANQAPGRYRSNSVDEMLRRLQEFPRSSRLYLAAYAATPEVSVRGRDYPDLPPSAQILLGGRQAADASARWGRASRLGEVWREYDWIVSGGTTLTVEISPHAPAAAAGRRRAGANPQMEEPPDEEPGGPED
jgi:hypothetical protein